MGKASKNYPGAPWNGIPAGFFAENRAFVSPCPRSVTAVRSCRQVELTSARFPHLRRGQFSQLTDRDVTHFSQLLGADRVLTEDLDGYNTDWMRSVRGESGAATVWRAAGAICRACQELIVHNADGRCRLGQMFCGSPGCPRKSELYRLPLQSARQFNTKSTVLVDRC